MLQDKRTWGPEDIVRKLSHFIDGYKQFPGEPLLICYLELVITHQLNWILCFLFKKRGYQPIHVPSLSLITPLWKPRSLKICCVLSCFSMVAQNMFYPECPCSSLKSCSLVSAIFKYSFLCSSIFVGLHICCLRWEILCKQLC